MIIDDCNIYYVSNGFFTTHLQLLQEVSPPSFASYNDAKENPQSNRYTYNLPCKQLLHSLFL